ncbi:hypothetical protein [Nostoc sp.]|uniref:hypothetical protein n=1 Tax=Nostoc sp. TaxID=1180 RepID=UPI002FF9A82C
MALARFFKAMPISRRHSWAFSFGAWAASDRLRGAVTPSLNSWQFFGLCLDMVLINAHLC